MFVFLAHTYVPAKKRGLWLAGELCKATFVHGREHKLLVLPSCSYVSRWTHATLHRGVPQVSSASNFHTFTQLPSATSLDVLDKWDSSKTSVIVSSSTTAEETSKPIQCVDTPSDENGGDYTPAECTGILRLQELALVWSYCDIPGNSTWKGLLWKMIPLLGGDDTITYLVEL